MGEKAEKFLDGAALIGDNYRVFWNAVPHESDPQHPEDKDWADSEPDPDAP